MSTTTQPIEVKFHQIDGLDISMDIFLPDSATQAKPAPVLLWWHGGGLIQGTRKGTTPHLLLAPNKHGLCVVSADYRLAPQTRLPGILSDCKTAVDFIRSSAFRATTNGRADASKLIVSGSSAGGWLALMAGTGIGYAACGLEPPSGISGIAAIYPITDLVDSFWTTKKEQLDFFDRVIAREEVEEYLDPNGNKTSFSTLDSKRGIFYFYMVQEGILPPLLLGGHSISPEAFGIAAKIRTGEFSAPPTYIVHGTIDVKVPVSQATGVVAAYKDRGLPVEYHELRVDHLFDRDAIYGMDSMYSFIKQAVAGV